MRDSIQKVGGGNQRCLNGLRRGCRNRGTSDDAWDGREGVRGAGHGSTVRVEGGLALADQ